MQIIKQDKDLLDDEFVKMIKNKLSSNTVNIDIIDGTLFINDPFNIITPEIMFEMGMIYGITTAKYLYNKYYK